VSEAFARALASTAPIRTATVRAYLFTIARHYYLELRRRRARDVLLGDAVPDPAPDPSRQVEQSSELTVVRLALDRLPEIDRAVIIMRAVNSMTYEKIARTLGISVAAAKVKAHRARLALTDGR
jgi:RNA polymerase sigma-70 factor, ECF subfamily